MKIAACYIRVSTDDQLEYSPDSQLSAIQTYAKNNGYILPKEFIFIEQEGRSGRNAQKREAFQKMIGTAKLKPKPFDTLLLWKFSRFARNREDSIVYKSMLRKQGIDVISISEPIGDDKMSVILEAMIEAMDEYYSINLAEEVRRGMTEKIRRGENVTIAPFGYKIENKQLVIIPEQAEIVKAVFQKYVNGDSLRSIAVWLNDNNVKSRHGNQIQVRNIKYWLKNSIYNGYVHWSPVGNEKDKTAEETYLVKGIHEPIISDELWKKTQNKLKIQNSQPYKRWDNSTTFILSGIVRCAECNHALVRSSKVYMHCSGYNKGKCSHTQFTRIQDIIDMIKIGIASDLTNRSFIISPVSQDKEDTTPLKNQLTREKQKLDRAKRAYLDGIDTAAEYKSNKTAIQKEIDRLSAEIKRIEDIPAPSAGDLPPRCQSVLDLLNSDASDTAKNVALKSIIAKAVYSRENQTLQIFYY